MEKIGKISSLMRQTKYDPKVIDYSMEPRSQEMFQKDISAPVEAQIVHMTKLWKYISTHRIQKLI